MPDDGDNVIHVSVDELEGEHETKKFRDGQLEIQPVADRLIASVGSVGHLHNFDIRFIFARDELTSKGKRVLGKACKFGEKDKLLHHWSFLIIIDENFWKTYPDKREPLVLHELLHCGRNDEGNPAIMPHDLEEFGAVVKRYGAWATDVVMFNRQLELFAQERKEAVHE